MAEVAYQLCNLPLAQYKQATSLNPFDPRFFLVQRPEETSPELPRYLDAINKPFVYTLPNNGNRDSDFYPLISKFISVQKGT